MLRIVAFSFFLLLSVVSQAQTATWMAYASQGSRIAQHKIIGADKQGFYVYLSGPRERVVEKYSHNLNLIFSKKLPFVERNIEIEEVAIEDDHIKVFFSLYNLENARHGLFCTRIPFENGKDASPPTTLYDLPGLSPRDGSQFKVVQDAEHTLYANIHYQENNNREGNLKVSITNGELSVVQQAEILFNAPKTIYEIRNFLFDPSGNLLIWVYCVAQNEANSSPSRYYYRLYRVNRYDGNVEEIELRALDCFLNTVQIAVDKANQKVIMSGFTAAGVRTALNGSVIGIAALDTFRLEKVGFQHFSDDFKSKILSYKTSRREKDVADYQIRHLVPRTDGGVVLAAESEYRINQTYITYSQGFPVQQTVSYQYMEEIVLLSINPDGTLDWNTILPKSQVTQNEDFLNSFLMVPQKENLRFLFNEDGRYKSSVLQFTVNTFGEISPKLTVSPDVTDAVIIPQDAWLVNERTVLVPGIKRKKRGIFKLTYK